MSFRDLDAYLSEVSLLVPPYSSWRSPPFHGPGEYLTFNFSPAKTGIKSSNWGFQQQNRHFTNQHGDLSVKHVDLMIPVPPKRQTSSQAEEALKRAEECASCGLQLELAMDIHWSMGEMQKWDLWRLLNGMMDEPRSSLSAKKCKHSRMHFRGYFSSGSQQSMIWWLIWFIWLGTMGTWGFPEMGVNLNHPFW